MRYRGKQRYLNIRLALLPALALISSCSVFDKDLINALPEDSATSEDSSILEDKNTDSDSGTDTDADTDVDTDCVPPCDKGSCCDGTCVILSKDEANCGTCGNDCGSQTCIAGTCQDCTPDCTGKECGDDGCGGSCGECSNDEVCMVSQCEPCTPDCTGKECSDDGCGGLCGTCADPEVCVAGLCTADCTPECTGSACGDDDGCGVKCQGSCAGGGTCTEGVCVGDCTPDCADKECGDDGCGGTCGTCDGGEVCADAASGAPVPTYQCIDLSVGCSDGTREGFANTSVYPSIASCEGSFSPQSLRAPRTGAWCGNDLGPCSVPEDLCFPGWHICMKNGWPRDLTDRLNQADCHSANAGVGQFCAATDAANSDGCSDGYSSPYSCSEEIVCAPCCGQNVTQSSCNCLDGIWPNSIGPDGTWVSGTSCWNCATCGNADNIDGVLCCQDPPVVGY